MIPNQEKYGDMQQLQNSQACSHFFHLSCSAIQVFLCVLCVLKGYSTLREGIRGESCFMLSTAKRDDAGDLP